MPNADYAINYSIIADTFISTYFRYDMTVFITRDFSLSFDIAERFAQDSFIKYNISTNLQYSDFEILYAFPLHKDFNINYELVASLQADVGISYGMPDEAKADFEIAYDVLGYNPVHKDFVLFYDLQSIESETLQFVYLRD